MKLPLNLNAPTDYTHDLNKDDARDRMDKNIKKMSELQNKLYAQGKNGVLVILQGTDTCGKDSMIKHVMTGLNPQGTTVNSFKEPSKEELSHDYLWRYHNKVPVKGMIDIFNRSYYEEVLVVKVHNLVGATSQDFWLERYQQINNFEKYLNDNGIVVVKFFLNIGKDEQKKRLLSRIDDESKNWKFAESDIKERAYWNDYQKAYRDMIENTSTVNSPWYVIPSDKKWFSRLAVSEVLVDVLEGLEPKYPVLDKTHHDNLKVYRDKLINE